MEEVATGDGGRVLDVSHVASGGGGACSLLAAPDAGLVLVSASSD